MQLVNSNLVRVRPNAIRGKSKSLTEDTLNRNSSGGGDYWRACSIRAAKGVPLGSSNLVSNLKMERVLMLRNLASAITVSS